MGGCGPSKTFPTTTIFPTSPNVRRITEDDAKEIYDLNKKSFPPYGTLAMSTVQDHAAEGGGLVYVIDDKEGKENKKKVVGYLLYRYLNTDASSCCICDGNVLTINSIAVDSDYRRRGIGRDLIKMFKNFEEPLYLQVRVSNTSAINLYKQQGFETVCTLPEYYQCSDFEDAYYMCYKPPKDSRCC